MYMYVCVLCVCVGTVRGCVYMAAHLDFYFMMETRQSQGFPAFLLQANNGNTSCMHASRRKDFSLQ